LKPRPIKKTEIAGIIPRKRRYKVTKLVDGAFLSVIAGTGSYVNRPVLAYETGRVTEAPAFGKADKNTDASGLIFACDTLEQAIADAGRLGTSEARAKDTRAIFEVVPVGFMRANKKVDGVTMCEAVLVGEKVWEHSPAPEWEDITEDVESMMEDGLLKLYDINTDVEIATVGACGIQGSVTQGYKVTAKPDQTYKVEKLDDPDDC